MVVMHDAESVHTVMVELVTSFTICRRYASLAVSMMRGMISDENRLEQAECRALSGVSRILAYRRSNTFFGLGEIVKIRVQCVQRHGAFMAVVALQGQWVWRWWWPCWSRWLCRGAGGRGGSEGYGVVVVEVMVVVVVVVLVVLAELLVTFLAVGGRQCGQRTLSKNPLADPFPSTNSRSAHTLIRATTSSCDPEITSGSA
jgi:hypothetical protein